MTQRLTDMRIRQVSLVDKGANGRTFALLKRDEEGSMTAAAETAEQAPAGVIAWLRKALGLEQPAQVAKVATFAEIVAGQELRDALYDSWYTLEDAIWAAIYASDGDGQALPLETKKALIAQDLDEFKAYLLAQMDSGIEKRDGGPAEAATRHIAAVVAKAGRKISGARLERLQAASEALTSVLAEVAEVTEEAGADAQEDEVEKAEIEAIVKATVAELHKAAAHCCDACDGMPCCGNGTQACPASCPGAACCPDCKPVAKADADGEGGALTLEGVAKAVLEMREDLDAVLKTRGERTSVAGQDDAGDDVKKRRWSGVF